MRKFFVMVLLLVAGMAHAFISPPDWIIGTWRYGQYEWSFTSSGATLRSGSGTLTISYSDTGFMDSSRGFKYEITVISPYGMHDFELVEPGRMKYRPPIGGDLMMSSSRWRKVDRSVSNRSSQTDAFDMIDALLQINNLMERIEALEKRVEVLEKRE